MGCLTKPSWSGGAAKVPSLAGQASRSTRSQSISPPPNLVSSLLASENGRLVRNPRHADTGDGCEDLITAWRLRSTSLGRTQGIPEVVP